ncbi:Mo-nitrogenase MoFe protein subunit NifK [Trichormus variabilis ATCC 29413]|uniref:Nitrogenase molybdenum-iron protein beta chain n=2 Tax=Anabaena variabilis TaxID=264691 RepID=Q3M588_TRIV2|nr:MULTISPECIES: nitrogenase molybdenum-iron protein subunit beta [Nostocaceae]ABA23848.1 Mo-nitrogenase MoFe protein subunit NifK [Trichormus variabilis ATCC 29413]MBC1214473.1 nitrogenase molybdenum-iron protein subunit beta [Trichormus variabilis ARAD]MBC1256224.1 nitrogenase molybdenum-iron protein subunit beta [Trichormus variabilis V5]MBC1268675.1 nitrogenase molybdenum-iron protein subunit beta [Trichormus variabilis FSR]MBC1300419.1 nitrogenase molybdenum-iron protein subunit beta [Tri
MAQNDVNKIKDHAELFQQQEYQELFQAKKEFECGHNPEEVTRIAEWTKTWEYREKNFARQALTVNPAKACQPLGSILAAVGFEGTLPFVHGSQGCVAYFRSHLTRHFKEPFSAVSSSMTEDAAVFGGLKNLVEGLAVSYNLYKPKMIAVCTTCMAEVIGDDLQAFIRTAKEEGAVPEDFPVPYAHTPSFVGSHILGYDNMMKGILSNLTARKKKETTNGKINFIPGFETYIGNLREIKRIANVMGINYTLLADNSEYLDSPNNGEYNMYPGGTKLEDAADSINAEATIALQAYATTKTREYIEHEWQHKTYVNRPVGIRGTDEFLMKLSALTGKPIPQELEDERGRAVDALTDSQAWLHGKRVAMYGDPDLVIGLTQFLLEVGAEPVHIVVSNSNEHFEAELRALLDSSPFGQGATIHGGRDLWHMRSLLFTEPVDLLIGNSYGKYLWRDTKTPFVRIGYPIFDRHHLHRYATYGYQGTINLLNWIVNTILDELDRNTIIPSKTDISYDLIR